MKYAFIFGSNLFVVPGNTINYIDHEQTTRFLRIATLYKDPEPGKPHSFLTIDTDIKDFNGHTLRLTGNRFEDATGFQILEQHNRVLVTHYDGTTFLDVLQLDDRSAMHLEHNIIAELEVNRPVVAIRLRGNFLAGDIHVEIDNEKLFVDNESQAGSVLAGDGDLLFSHSGVIL